MDSENSKVPNIAVWMAVSAIPILLTIGFGALAIIGSGGHIEIMLMVPFGLVGVYMELGASQRAAIMLMLYSYMAYGIVALIATFAFSIRLKLALCAILFSIGCTNLYGCQMMAKGFSKITMNSPEAPNQVAPDEPPIRL